MITVFTTDSCGGCASAKAYLKQRGVEYQEVNVQENEENMLLYKVFAGGAKVVPVIIIGDNIIEGFNKEKIDDLLAQQ
jgi:glutaredoxin-like YruB-family protein